MKIFELLSDLSEKHENLKKRIHSFRIPLSPTGQKFMGFFYFTVPLIIGYYIMEFTNVQASKNLAHLNVENSTHRQETRQQNDCLKSIIKKTQTNDSR